MEPIKMMLDRSYQDDPEFKKKLFLLDDIVNNTTVAPKQHVTKILNTPSINYGIDCDEVFPSILVGNAAAARNKSYLLSNNVTHVLNCAQGENLAMVSTDKEYYQNEGIRFKGLKLNDCWSEDITRYFDEATLFIEEALSTGGRVLIHCLAGISRSATIAIAYLMIRHKYSVESAVLTVRRNRYIRPNEGFLRQLVQLDFKLRSQNNEILR